MVDDAYTKVLLHMNGSDESTTFTDEGGHTFTPSNGAQLDTAIKKFGTASGLFDGDAYLTGTNSSDFSPGTGAFTIDFWAYIQDWAILSALVDLRSADTNTVNDMVLFAQWVADHTPWVYGLGVGGTGTNLSVAFSLDTWTHVAIVGNGGADGSRTVKVYIDGVLAATITANYNLNKDCLMVGGHKTTTGYNLNGNIDEFRLSIGIERWTSNFTPPTSEYTGSSVKTINGLARASIKSVNGLAIASVKTKNGLA